MYQAQGEGASLWPIASESAMLCTMATWGASLGMKRVTTPSTLPGAAAVADRIYVVVDGGLVQV
jgi:hypothetical protein